MRTRRGVCFDTINLSTDSNIKYTKEANMPLQVNGKKTSTEKTKPVTKMQAGEVFHFTSTKDPKNTGNYIRIASKEAKGLNLSNFKAMKFTPTEVGVPKDASMTIEE